MAPALGDLAVCVGPNPVIPFFAVTGRPTDAAIAHHIHI